jgi:hypothetical protein
MSSLRGGSDLSIHLLVVVRVKLLIPLVRSAGVIKTKLFDFCYNLQVFAAPESVFEKHRIKETATSNYFKKTTSKELQAWFHERTGKETNPTDNNFPWWLFDFFFKKKLENHDCISDPYILDC